MSETQGLTDRPLSADLELCESVCPPPWSRGATHSESEGKKWLYFTEQEHVGPPSMEDAGLDYQPGGPLAAVYVGEFPRLGEFFARSREGWEAAIRECLRLRATEAQLLAALRDVMGWIHNWDPQFVFDAEWPASRAAVDAAIAKAAGTEGGREDAAAGG